MALHVFRIYLVPGRKSRQHTIHLSRATGDSYVQNRVLAQL